MWAAPVWEALVYMAPVRAESVPIPAWMSVWISVPLGVGAGGGVSGEAIENVIESVIESVIEDVIENVGMRSSPPVGIRWTGRSSCKGG